MILKKHHNGKAYLEVIDYNNNEVLVSEPWDDLDEKCCVCDDTESPLLSLVSKWNDYSSPTICKKCAVKAFRTFNDLRRNEE